MGDTLHSLINQEVFMNRRQLNSLGLAPVLSLLTLFFTLPAQADNRAFLSTSLEASQASYLLEFSATTGGSRIKIHSGEFSQQCDCRLTT